MKRILEKVLYLIKFKWFSNLKTVWKLVLILGVLSLAGVGGGIYSSITLDQLGKQTNSLFFNTVQAILEASYTKIDIDEVRFNVYNIVNRGDVHVVDMLKRFVPRMDMHVVTLKKKVDTESVESVLYFEDTWERHKPKFLEAIENPNDFVGTQKGRALSQSVQSLWQDVILIETDLQNISIKDLKKATEDAKKKSDGMKYFVGAMLFVALLLGFFTVTSISKPLRSLRQAMIGLAQGDLQLPKLSSATKDEIGETSKAYEESLKQLREMIAGVSLVTGTLTSLVTEISPQIEATGAAADMVSQTMNELAKGTQETARAADEAACTIHNVVEQVERANSKAQVIANYSTTVIAEAKQGEEDTKAILNQVNELASASNKATGVIHNLEGHSHQIEEIIGKIREITEQTQLLSLNASIEAARAGEYGRGFGVVAHEVGKLAQKSAQAVQDVEQVLGNIQTMVMDAVHVMEEGVSKANDGKRMISETSERFNQIFGSINKVAAEIQEVADETSKLTAANQRVLEEIDTIAAISEQTAANTEEVMATVDSQASSVGEVSHGMKKLNEASEDLKRSVSKFRL